MNASRPAPPILAMPASKRRETSSRWVACAAGLCAVHCLLTPVLAVVAPFLVLAEGREWWLWGGTVALAALMVAIGPGRRRWAIAGLVLGGAAVWAASLKGWFLPIPETVTSPIGSLLVAGAMVWSARLCRSGACEVKGRERDG